MVSLHQSSSDKEKMPSPMLIVHENYPTGDFNEEQKNHMNNRFQSLCVECGGDDEERMIIRSKQKRILLIRHATKCQKCYEGTPKRCAIGAHCRVAKKLCEHIKTCKDLNCSYSNCLSTRQIITHYRKCKDGSCPVCVPVNKLIKKSKRKSSDSA